MTADTLTPEAQAVLRQALNLDADERIAVALELWGSLVRLQGAPDVPDWHLKILDQRLSSPDTDENTLSADEVWQRLQAVLGAAGAT
jgi:hypothetical protein